MKHKEIKSKFILVRWLCRHNWFYLDDVRGFFGIQQCEKCGEYRTNYSELFSTSFSLSVPMGYREEKKK